MTGIPSLRAAAGIVCMCLAALFALGTNVTQSHASEWGGSSGPSFGGGIIIRIPTQIHRQPQCSFPFVASRGRCVCARGFRLRNGRCVERVQTVRCKFPWVKHRGGCACARGYQKSGRRCVRVVATCGPNEYFSRKRQSCFCRKGYKKIAGTCTRPTVVERECGPNSFYSKRRGRCVCSKGYRKSGGICEKPQRVAECTQAEYYSKKRKRCLCRNNYKRIDGECRIPVIAQPPVEPAPPVTPAPPKVAQLPANCLPGDLFDALANAYGKPPSMSRCDAACLPKPAAYSAAELANLSQRHGITWCESCIKLGGYLPLASIRLIEQSAGVTLCMSDGWRMCSAPGYASVDPGVTKTKIRTVIRRYPVTLGKRGDIAIVIGNETYKNGIITNSNAQSDADAVMTMLSEQLGYNKSNIIDIRNASYSDLLRIFGGPDGTPGELQKLYGNRKDGDIFIYVSSHGLSDSASGKSYLMPVDARLDQLDSTAYSLEDLYDALGKIGARTVMLALEASFGQNLTTNFVDPPNLPGSDISVLPKKLVPGLAVFTAADRDQHTLDDPEFGTGLFTRYLIEGMAGGADAVPTGNDDKRIDSVELHVYTAHMVRQAARKSFGMEQKPILSKIDNLLIGRLAAN